MQANKQKHTHSLFFFFINIFLSPVLLPVFNLDALGPVSLYISVVSMPDGTKAKYCLWLESVA